MNRWSEFLMQPTIGSSTLHRLPGVAMLNQSKPVALDYQGRSQKLHVGGGAWGPDLQRDVRDGCRLTIHPTPPPRLPLHLVYTQKYLNFFECTQPYFVLLQETLKFFSLLSRGPRPPGPPLATPLPTV